MRSCSRCAGEGPSDEASINSIVLEAKRTADLVKNLLAFSRKESKKREVIGVNELIKQAVNLKKLPAEA